MYSNIILFFTSLGVASCTSQESAFRSRNNKAAKFVENLTQKVFPNCAVTLLYNTEPSSDILTINTILSSSFRTLGKEVHTIVKNETYLTLRMKKHVQYKFLGSCRLVIILSIMTQKYKCEEGKSLSPAFTDSLMEKLSLYPDTDFYAFLTNLSPTSNCDFLKGTLSEKLKYKLIVYDESVTEIARNEGKEECMVKGAHINVFLPKMYNKPASYINVEAICRKLKRGIETVYINDVFPDFTRNLYGHTIRVSVPTKISGFLQLGKNEDGSWFAKRGKEMYLLEAAKAKFNFTSKLFPSTGINNDSTTYGSSGTQLSNGEWIGSIGDLLNDRADFSTTSGPSPTRVLIMDFVSFFGFSTLTFIVGKPNVVFSWTAIFQVFGIKLWVALLFICAFAVLYFVLLNKCSISNIQVKYPNSNRANDKKRFQVWSIKRTTHYMFATLLGQDIPDPKFNPTRVFFAFWLFFSMVISTVYVSKLVTFLAFPREESIPLTFTELVNSDYAWGLHGGCRRGIGEAFIQNSVNPTYVKLYKQMELDPGDENCLSNCLVSKYACIVFKAISDFMIQRSYINSLGNHDFAYSSDSCLFVVCSWMMKKGSIYHESLNHISKMARDSGLIDKWEKIDHSLLRTAQGTSGDKNEQNNKKKPVTTTSLSLKNFTASLVVLLAGYILAATTLITEKIYMNVKIRMNTTAVNSFNSKFNEVH